MPSIPAFSMPALALERPSAEGGGRLHRKMIFLGPDLGIYVTSKGGTAGGVAETESRRLDPVQRGQKGQLAHYVSEHEIAPVSPKHTTLEARDLILFGHLESGFEDPNHHHRDEEDSSTGNVGSLLKLLDLYNAQIQSLLRRVSLLECRLDQQADTAKLVKETPQCPEWQFNSTLDADGTPLLQIQCPASAATTLPLSDMSDGEGSNNNSVSSHSSQRIMFQQSQEKEKGESTKPPKPVKQVSFSGIPTLHARVTESPSVIHEKWEEWGNEDSNGGRKKSSHRHPNNP